MIPPDQRDPTPTYESIKAEIAELLHRHLDKTAITAMLRRIAFGGFDNYADYEKYGDVFQDLSVLGPVFNRYAEYERLTHEDISARPGNLEDKGC